MKGLLWFTALTWMLASPAINAQDDPLLELAKGGNLGAQYLVGYLAVEGEHYPRDVAERWLQPLAEAGLRGAYASLCQYYFLEEEYGIAARWCLIAKWHGHADAQAILGIMKYQGNGTSKSAQDAMEDLWPSAMQGVPASQLLVARMHHFGESVPKDYVLAYAFYNSVAAQGHEGAAEARDVLEDLMTPAQIAKAQKISASIPYVSQTQCFKKVDLNAVGAAVFLEDSSELEAALHELAQCEMGYPFVGEGE